MVREIDRANTIEEEEDRISNLPDEIIHIILSFLDMKYAVQTSTLSKKWKLIWTTMPTINLNSRTFRSYPKFIKFVKHTLSHRNNRTEVSAVDLTFRGIEVEFLVDMIVNYAYTHNVRKLSIKWFSHLCSSQFTNYIFSSHTLKHLTLNDDHQKTRVPKSGWDFPALETLNLSNMCLGDVGDKRLDLFSKSVNLKELTLHRISMFGLKIFNIYNPQLSHLTITDFSAFPRIFNIKAPQLKNLTATVNATIVDVFKKFHFSTKGFDSLEEVNLCLSNSGNKKEVYVPVLHDLFSKLRNPKFLIINDEIVESLSLCVDQVVCPFYNLKWLKIDKIPCEGKDHIAIQVRYYLLKKSPGATFIMDLPQKKSRKQEDNDTECKKKAKMEEFKVQG